MLQSKVEETYIVPPDSIINLKVVRTASTHKSFIDKQYTTFGEHIYIRGSESVGIETDDKNLKIDSFCLWCITCHCGHLFIDNDINNKNKDLNEFTPGIMFSVCNSHPNNAIKAMNVSLTEMHQLIDRISSLFGIWYTKICRTSSNSIDEFVLEILSSDEIKAFFAGTFEDFRIVKFNS